MPNSTSTLPVRSGRLPLGAATATDTITFCPGATTAGATLMLIVGVALVIW
jgi:hypothetical protein